MIMASLTIRNIPDEAKLRFRQIAAAHGRSMEEHLRQMVIEAGLEERAGGGVRDVTQSFRHFEPELADPKAKSRARIEHLIALGRGIDWEPPKREVGTIKDTDFS
jgi:plasmid stability protein